MKAKMFKLLWCKLFHIWDPVAYENGTKLVCPECQVIRKDDLETIITKAKK